jgi:uncharacterized membrane protein YfcA
MNTSGPMPTNSGSLIRRAGGSLITWFALDCAYLLAVFAALPNLPISRPEFLLAHGLGIVIATMVMFTGLGAGVLWIPLLVFLHVKPSEAVSISIFTQIAGKGVGSFNYFRAGMVDRRVARYFIPFACIGVALGYGAGFVISREYERLLLYLFVSVAVYLLIKMVKSLGQEQAREHGRFTDEHLRKSRLIVIVSSFFTGLLSIGNSDWLIPHMERHLDIPTSRAVATGLFVMFCGSVFFLCLTALAVLTGIEAWPQSSPLLLATCSGVIVGGQIGTRLVQVQWLKGYQKHAFILMLGLSIIHLLW